jgi:hypothetical protein
VHAIVTEHGVIAKPSRRALAPLQRVDAHTNAPRKEKGPE